MGGSLRAYHAADPLGEKSAMSTIRQASMERPA